MTSFKSIRFLKHIGVASVLALLAAACDDDKKSGAAGPSISMKVDYNAVAKTQTDTVIVDTAKILIRNVKFKNSVDEDSQDFKIGPFVVYLDLTGGVHNIAIGAIPPGTYDRVKFKIHKPEDNETPPDPEFKIGTGGNERFSVIIKGRYHDSSFVYRTKKDIEQEMNLNPPLVIVDSLSNVNVTLLVNPSGWFRDQNGAFLDPTLESNEDEIDDNIRDSFKKAVRDDDEDGDDDEGDD